MAEEYKNAPEEFKNETTPKIDTTETVEVKPRGMFDFLKKKEEVKPQETTPTTATPIESEFEHKAQISDPPAVVAKHEEEEQKEHKPTLLEKLHQKHEDEEENNPNLLHKLHRSNSSSSSSSDEEGEDGVKRKKEKKKTIVMEPEQVEKIKEEDKEGLMEQIKEKFPHGTKTEDHTEKFPHGTKTEDHTEKFPHGTKTEDHAPVVNTVPVAHETAEKKGAMEKIKEKLPGHSKKPEESQVVNTEAIVPPPVTEETPEKKGIMEKIKEKLGGHHTKEEKKGHETHV